MQLESIGIVGNCQYAAHIDHAGSVVWCCLPRFDAEPTFGALLDSDGGGFFTIGPEGGGTGVQSYLENTNVLETRFTTVDGAFRVLDFAPRFQLHGRSFRPTKLVRIVEPLSGAPRVQVRCRPVLGWSKLEPRREHGSNHISFHGYDADVRLTTDVPLSYVDGPAFALTQTRRLVFSWGAPVEEPLAPLCDRFMRETVAYWRLWVKHCDVPPAYQREVIRSALVLKLHCFEDTGAILAATTTSIPEAPGSGRTWDYRYCWLRDAYYALGAFRLLGHFEEREQFLDYLLNVASSARDLALAPLYRIDGKSDLDESVLSTWRGYAGDGPVRVGNGAATHLQHDIYGEMVLALSGLFLDDRFRHEQTASTRELLVGLARKAVSVAGTPDAGIWEYRTSWKPQTFSSLMCWAAADRAARIIGATVPSVEAELRTAATRIKDEIFAKAWDPVRGALVSTYGGTDLDASLIQAVPLRLFEPGDPRASVMLDRVVAQLDVGGWLRRYRADDGFGVPSVAFVVCTFWLIEALAFVGRTDDARLWLQRALQAASPLGLFAEDYDPVSGRLHGNYPQAYSHVGLIHAAFAASPRWQDVL